MCVLHLFPPVFVSIQVNFDCLLVLVHTENVTCAGNDTVFKTQMCNGAKQKNAQHLRHVWKTVVSERKDSFITKLIYGKDWLDACYIPCVVVSFS